MATPFLPGETRIADLILNPQMRDMAGQMTTAVDVQLESLFHSSRGLSDSFLAPNKVAIAANTLALFKRNFSGVQRDWR